MYFFIRRIQPKNSTAHRMMAAAWTRNVEPVRAAPSFRTRHSDENPPNTNPTRPASFQRVLLSSFIRTKVTLIASFSKKLLTFASLQVLTNMVKDLVCNTPSVNFIRL